MAARNFAAIAKQSLLTFAKRPATELSAHSQPVIIIISTALPYSTRREYMRSCGAHIFTSPLHFAQSSHKVHCIRNGSNVDVDRPMPTTMPTPTETAPTVCNMQMLHIRLTHIQTALRWTAKEPTQFSTSAQHKNHYRNTNAVYMRKKVGMCLCVCLCFMLNDCPAAQ